MSVFGGILLENYIKYSFDEQKAGWLVYNHFDLKRRSL